MTSLPSQQLDSLVRSWIATVVSDPQAFLSGSAVVPCVDQRFGDYQTNVAMNAARVLKRNPREIAAELVEFCCSADFIETPEVAGPGFVNFRFTRRCLEQAVESLIDRGPNITPDPSPRRIVVDFSAPNVAKEMHVGHIRSTILGDCIARLLTARGHTVIRDNHIGDWGTQFGKMILGYKERGQPPLPDEGAIALMQEIYQTTHQRCNESPELLNQARAELKKLQDGDPENVAIWKLFRERSESAFQAIYDRLDIRFDHTLGESFYNDQLKPVVEELRRLNIARKSEGAVVVFFDAEDGEGLEQSPFLIEKSDGAALYSTTDLATLKFRQNEWHADEVVYVTDGRQQLHFRQLFATARRWGLTVQCHHVWFGAILGADKKPLKTRDGSPIRLRDLLDESEQRAHDTIVAKQKAAVEEAKRRGRTKVIKSLPPEEEKRRDQVIGIGALKYADLSQNRHLDYVFDWDKLLAFEGNTAPYLLNAYVRSRSILRKAAATGLEPGAGSVTLADPHERDLARQLLELDEAVSATIREFRPHLLCLYLYDLATRFHQFFEHCHVTNAETPELARSRLRLCQLTGDTLALGLGLLGIPLIEEM